MTYRFVFKPDADQTEIRLTGPSGAGVPYERWALEAPDDLLPGIDLAQRLVASDSAIGVDDALLINSQAVAGLSAREASCLALPPLAQAVARLEAHGLITQPSYRVSLAWARTNGQPILGAERIGTWLRIGEHCHRLPDVLFAIAEAVDAFNASPSERTDERLRALAALREALPAGVDKGLAQAQGLLGQITIAVADAFSLDLQDDGGVRKLRPILYRAQSPRDESLLPSTQQQEFWARFDSAGKANPVYALGRQWFVVLQPPLRRALAEVRRVNDGFDSARRAFMANPRAHLREALGDEVEDVVLESVFRETATYAERVIGLGLWAPRVVPWIKLRATKWFGDPIGADKRPERPISKDGPISGIRVGDDWIGLEPDQLQKLRDDVERAIAGGSPVVGIKVGERDVAVPATHETLVAIQKLETEQQGRLSPSPPGSDRPDIEVLVIKPNEEQVEIAAEVRPDRPAPAHGEPNCVATRLKAHQSDGLAWLQQAWKRGSPGVLLADDMGLGKTLQGLAFLAWLADGMRSGIVPRAPLLVVAPTGLLKNWLAEYDAHFKMPGLGRCAEAFGKGLGRLKRRASDGLPGLDLDALRHADWVLTTYETLRDYDRDFGQIRFAAALFDEAQKIKTPAARVTDAAKAMNCEFRVALTGTPVENRLADLWCIVDGVQPGALDDLTAFSAQYEQGLNVDKLKRLKNSLERPLGGRPPLMLRRLRRHHLPDLPPPQEREIRETMPPAQREAYDRLVEQARTVSEPGAMLESLQRLRSISLHPAPETSPDAGFISASARVQATFDALDEIAASKEKALLFLDDIELQSRLAGVIQRRYRLPAPPAIINGSVDGSSRQARVDAFQAAPDGFGVMILSPRAGGVGLTLTRANHVIHLSRWWNPAIEDQCTGRAQRIGQTRQVYVHIPMAVLDGGSLSFDENLSALLDRKRKLMNETLMPPEATANADRDELFRATIPL